MIIGLRYCLGAHEPLGEFARRHPAGRIPQLVIDQPKAFTLTESGTACSLPFGTDLLRPDVRIKQLHRRVEMRQIRPLLRKLLLELSHYPLPVLLACCVRTDHMQLGQLLPSPGISTIRIVNGGLSAANAAVVAAAT